MSFMDPPNMSFYAPHHPSSSSQDTSNDDTAGPASNDYMLSLSLPSFPFSHPLPFPFPDSDSNDAPTSIMDMGIGMGMDMNMDLFSYDPTGGTPSTEFEGPFDNVSLGTPPLSLSSPSEGEEQRCVSLADLTATNFDGQPPAPAKRSRAKRTTKPKSQFSLFPHEEEEADNHFSEESDVDDGASDIYSPSTASSVASHGYSPSASATFTTSRPKSKSKSKSSSGSVPTLPPAEARPRGTAPLPVPVPNLTKKSRGRKVPTNPSRVRSDDYHGGNAVTKGKGKKGRVYRCTVEDCGKLFVRGEHLKRHVRSIHTHEKPHDCPYAGCDKSFSRRDNLGQHLRVHQ